MPVQLDANNKFNEILPDEMIQKIFFYLDDSELRKCRQVCRKWQELASDEYFLKTRYSEPLEAFGKDKWDTLIGKIGEVPHLPNNIK